MKRLSVIIIIFALLFVAFNKAAFVYAQQAARSIFCTKVGNPSGDNPCPPPTASKLPPGTSASCPVPNGKIGCGSYGSPKDWGGFYGACGPDSTGNGGHCNVNYQNQVKICFNREEGGNLIRTAKSIDVASAGGSGPGDPVYLPTIKGQSLKWYYKGTVDAGSGFGWMRVFQSEPTSEGVYSLHFVHVNNDKPALSNDQMLSSGEVGATMFNLGDGYIHVHVTVGLNVGDPLANNLQLYSPGWLFADRDLGMCTGGK